MHHIVSISLGTSKRDKRSEVEILGERFLLERIGVDGDLKRYAEMFRELDGKVDVLGVGGADMYVMVGEKRYAWQQIVRITKSVKQTPVVDGSGLKHTLERETVRRLQADGTVDFRHSRTLLVSGVDRFGMAQSLVECGGPVVYGDLMFGMGLPIPLRNYATVRRLGSILLPILSRLPQTWFYPTGEKQEKRTPKFAKAFEEADIICGDWHFIGRYLPDRIDGKTILTQTLRKADLAMLREMGAARAITTTPAIDGESFPTNVMEGVIVALRNKPPEEIRPEEYLETLRQLSWKPNVFPLN